MYHSDTKKKAKSFTLDDVRLLLKLINEFPCLTSKRTNTVSNVMKEQGWRDLTEKYNSSINSGVQRDMTQIKSKWDNMKKAAKKRAMWIEENSSAIGEDKVRVLPDPILDCTLSILNLSNQSYSDLQSYFDDDKEVINLQVNNDNELVYDVEKDDKSSSASDNDKDNWEFCYVDSAVKSPKRIKKSPSSITKEIDPIQENLSSTTPVKEKRKKFKSRELYTYEVKGNTNHQEGKGINNYHERKGSNSHQEDNEYFVFGRHIASQMMKLSTMQFVLAQQEIQNILTRCRLKDLEKKTDDNQPMDEASDYFA